ncbi:7,8-didemethyl-8-hydroxy-5-deazariboflavin synthase subunit CofG [Lyngbya confervoides]|uniref:7,8-didemethyl-8-hydroxy-5-deazariboflavin synthase n=1 Tax=Lyngbya confervoides BDU141951 TaxID=1574623 RepID=A0ABD4T972_9CYAN|nr:7,8-didemethyl-8-hydroxy-5-deazariboflavin synthase subunit CofG [Lyngbya confervoides]MCM1984994.1 7,8-didemethyl-8-hydroxy-5-deazariboflavin synthase subunit CofG [Lyngbya confervoides BDU141951]
MPLKNRRDVPGVITYSPAFTLVPTYECFNRCTYCNFRQDPGGSRWLSLTAAQQQLQQFPAGSLCEVLILSGEVHPRSPRRRSWVDHIYRLCDLALSLGFLPHSNVGPLTVGEMERLARVNVSMGLMLEQMTPRLMETVHRQAPSKRPDLRLAQIQQAGQLGIPFTTGLLLGLGETPADWRDTLQTIAQVQRQWGHIQEVILQPYQPGSREVRGAPGFCAQDLVSVVELARDLLPEEIALQIPPNLIQDEALLRRCLQAGATDLGGLGPIDQVNPDYPHPHLGRLERLLDQWGFQLRPRLPVYPQFESRLPVALQRALQPWKQQFAAKGVSPSPSALPNQAPSFRGR